MGLETNMEMELFLKRGRMEKRNACHTWGSLNNSVVFTVISLTTSSTKVLSVFMREISVPMLILLSVRTLKSLRFNDFSEYWLKSYLEVPFKAKTKS